MADLTPTDLARFDHWMDLHHMQCGKPTCFLCQDHPKDFSSDQLWEELAYFEAADIPLLPMPKLGQVVHITCGGAVLRGYVSYLYADRDLFMVNTQAGHICCTQFELVSPDGARDG